MFNKVISRKKEKEKNMDINTKYKENPTLATE